MIVLNDRDIDVSRAERAKQRAEKANRRSKTSGRYRPPDDVRLLLCIVQSIESMCQKHSKRRPVVCFFISKTL